MDLWHGCLYTSKVEHGGLHSGFMIAHCTAAALTSENKVLCHPSSVDTISTSGSKEDHVSMGGFSARKVSHLPMLRCRAPCSLFFGIIVLHGYCCRRVS